jgi:hypothetical protein
MIPKISLGDYYRKNIEANCDETRPQRVEEILNTFTKIVAEHFAENDYSDHKSLETQLTKDWMHHLIDYGIDHCGSSLAYGLSKILIQGSNGFLSWEEESSHEYSLIDKIFRENKYAFINSFLDDPQMRQKITESHVFSLKENVNLYESDLRVYSSTAKVMEIIAKRKDLFLNIEIDLNDLKDIFDNNYDRNEIHNDANTESYMRSKRQLFKSYGQ